MGTVVFSENITQRGESNSCWGLFSAVDYYVFGALALEGIFGSRMVQLSGFDTSVSVLIVMKVKVKLSH